MILLALTDSAQMRMETLEWKNFDRGRKEVRNVVAVIKKWVHDATLTTKTT